MARTQKPKTHYKGDIVAGSLLLKESRTIADLLIGGVAADQISARVLSDNLLQKRSPATARRETALILKRLCLVDERFWLMIRDGSQELSTQALLCAAIKHSRLLGDFIHKVIRTKIKTFQTSLSIGDWGEYFEQCQQVDPELGSWSETTSKKVRQVVFRILAESKIIESTRSKKLLPFSLHPKVRSALEDNEEGYILRCLEIFQ